VVTFGLIKTTPRKALGVATPFNGEEIIRIISAREANQRERRIYIQQAAE
jgi:uncharacterized DUF497 family protein